MNDKLLELAMEIQGIAQSGLAYCKDVYDKERYERLRQISVEMLAEKTELAAEKIAGIFCNDSGYQTPKVDTRAAIFNGDKILMVHEKNDTWSLPGGWCDVNQSVASNVVKEVEEETGLKAKAERIIAVHDWRKHNVCNYVYGVVKIFVLCKTEGGSFKENVETSEIKYFAKDELPENLAVEKTTKEQILTCFKASENENFAPELD